MTCRRHLVLLSLVSCLLLAASSCRNNDRNGDRRDLTDDPCAEKLGAGAAASCTLDTYPDRSYEIFVPPGDVSDPRPVLILLHGGGGDAEGGLRTTCPKGDTAAPGCLHRLAAREGFVLAAPNGTDGLVGTGFRTWNAGGGTDEWRCISGRACEEGVDDVGYISAVLDDIAQRVSVDADRVYATGLSNGAAMSYRLACEMGDRIAAIAPIGGAMQYTTDSACRPGREVPVLHTHGTDDPCWVYTGGANDPCLGRDDGKKRVSVQRTLREWRTINGCIGDFSQTVFRNTAADGQRTLRQAWKGCDAPLVHLQIEGGGHTWPNGWQYLPRRRIGAVSRDWGNAVLWEFLSSHDLGD